MSVHVHVRVLCVCCVCGVHGIFGMSVCVCVCGVWASWCCDKMKTLLNLSEIA